MLHKVPNLCNEQLIGQLSNNLVLLRNFGIKLNQH